MKSETSENRPKFDLTSPDGVRAQGHAEQVVAVLLNDTHWYQIVPGSFKYYVTGGPAGSAKVPFVVFELDAASEHPLAGYMIEVFPATIAGIAYAKAPEPESEPIPFNPELLNS